MMPNSCRSPSGDHCKPRRERRRTRFPPPPLVRCLFEVEGEGAEIALAELFDELRHGVELSQKRIGGAVGQADEAAVDALGSVSLDGPWIGVGTKDGDRYGAPPVLPSQRGAAVDRDRRARPMGPDSASGASRRRTRAPGRWSRGHCPPPEPVDAGFGPAWATARCRRSYRCRAGCVPLRPPRLRERPPGLPTGWNGLSVCAPGRRVIRSRAPRRRGRTELRPFHSRLGTTRPQASS